MGWQAWHLDHWVVAMIEYPVRRWRPSDDLARLVVVSQAADVMFAAFGLSLPPDDPTDELLRAEHVLVAGSPPVGFAVVNTVDGRAHLAGLGVHPEFGRRGVGGRLLTAACALATELGRPAMTLTTFVDVPWNAPWYAARGFVELPVDRWGTGLRDLWATEVAAGIVVAPRLVMIRSLRSGAASAQPVPTVQE
jgi:GNAT superfamily N-acetyltransferase